MEIEEFLKIEIEIDQQNEKSFSVVVTFTNTSSKVVNWEFRNVLSKAESLSFKLHHLDGTRIDPVDGPLGTPSPSPEAPEFLPGATQEHRIECFFIKDGLLKVGRVHYHPVPQITKYNISFHYGRVKSNVVQWVSPKI